MASKIHHKAPSLGADIIGIVSQDGDLAVFRGIPFASVEKRWTGSQKTDSLNSPFDATEFGPRCPQPPATTPLVTGGPTETTPGDDELKCLHLNICVPKESLGTEGSTGKLLPVMFYIHGGAFSSGANSVARYRPEPLSIAAKQAGTPVVLVQIQYRLGPLGFAASPDLALEDSKSMGNYGYLDQRNAFEWVRDHIKDFGGDPSNVTAFGVSAGSASIHYHIIGGDPLFDRAILMSGAAPILGPNPYHEYEAAWDNLIKKTNITEDTPSSRLKKLRSISPDEIIRNYPVDLMGPMGDGTLLPKPQRIGFKQPSTRCKAMIVGDTNIEAIILDSFIQQLPQPYVQSVIQKCFSPSDAASLRSAFNLIAEEMTAEKWLHSMRHFLSVYLFQYPNIALVETLKEVGEVYYYHFEEQSPHEGLTKGISHHGLDAHFVHMGRVDEYPVKSQGFANEMAGLWSGFAHGMVPWEGFEKEGRFMRLGPGGEKGMMGFEEDEVRDYGYLPWVRGHFEEIRTFFNKLTNRNVFVDEA